MLKNPLRSTVQRHDGIPVLPGAFPLVGHLPALYLDAPGLYREGTRAVGPLFWVEFLGGGRTLIWTEREAFDLFKNKVVSTQHYRNTVGELLGESMLAQDGAPHQHARAALSLPFSPRGLSASRLGAVTAELVQATTRRWVQQRATVVLQETQELALNIIFRVLGVRSEELSAWRAHYHDLLLYSFGLRVRLPGFPHYRADKARRWLEGRLSTFINEARRRGSAGEDDGLLAAMVHGRDDAGEGLSERELLDNIRLIAFAGHETTASTMAWLALELARRPELWDALVAEAERAEGLPTSPQEIRSYPVAEGLFREVLRIYPPVSAPARSTTEDMTIRGHRIPKGTVLGVCVAHFSLDPDLYPDPERFDPARWKGRAVTPIETCQFGGGPHFCLGYHLAWMEVVQFALSLAREASRAGVRPRLAPGASLRPVYFPLTRPPARAQITFS